MLTVSAPTEIIERGMGRCAELRRAFWHHYPDAEWRDG